MPLFRSSPMEQALEALERERNTGEPAELAPDVQRLAELLATRGRAAASKPGELAAWGAILAALPDAAAIIDREDTVRLANAPFDAIAPGGRAAGLKLLEALRNADVLDAVRRSRDGTRQRLELETGLVPRTWMATAASVDQDRTLLLMRDVTDARRAAASRRDFVANASHELRTPISAIIGAAETLLESAAESPDDARHFASIIARHASRLARLTQDLLDLSRIESGQWPMKVEPVLVEPVALGVIDLHRAAAGERGLTLKCEMPPRFWARADSAALEQVLVNLVDNAVKYTRDGGTVVVRGERTSREKVTIAVEDDGPGFDRHHLPRLFERFYRIDAGRSREQGGTGLGLAIVKHLVQAQGGEVGVESGAAGTRFWFRLGAA